MTDVKKGFGVAHDGPRQIRLQHNPSMERSRVDGSRHVFYDVFDSHAPHPDEPVHRVRVTWKNDKPDRITASPAQQPSHSMGYRGVKAVARMVARMHPEHAVMYSRPKAKVRTDLAAAHAASVKSGASPVEQAHALLGALRNVQPGGYTEPKRRSIRDYAKAFAATLRKSTPHILYRVSRTKSRDPSTGQLRLREDPKLGVHYFASTHQGARSASQSHETGDSRQLMTHMALPGSRKRGLNIYGHNLPLKMTDAEIDRRKAHVTRLAAKQHPDVAVVMHHLEDRLWHPTSSGDNERLNHLYDVAGATLQSRRHFARTKEGHRDYSKMSGDPHAHHAPLDWAELESHRAAPGVIMNDPQHRRSIVAHALGKLGYHGVAVDDEAGFWRSQNKGSIALLPKYSSKMKPRELPTYDRKSEYHTSVHDVINERAKASFAWQREGPAHLNYINQNAGKLALMADRRLNKLHKALSVIPTLHRKLGADEAAHHYHFHDTDKPDMRGELGLHVKGSKGVIGWVGGTTESGAKDTGPGAFGVGTMRKLLTTIRALHPEIKSLHGGRVSGVKIGNRINRALPETK